MSTPAAELVFGPVPSRRFGRSLGVNHVPPKTCTYACVYCQAGPTTASVLAPRPFLPPEELVGAVARRLEALRAAGEEVEVVSFVPDGEPTLDANLGAMVRGVRTLGVPVVVLTNGSLLFREEVRLALAAADRVSVKVDSVSEPVWRRVDRPHPALDLPTVLEGVRRFAASYAGTLLTETMLVAGSDDDTSLVETAAFVAALAPEVAYLAVPTRPPAVPGVRRPAPEAVLQALGVFRAVASQVQLLVADETGAFSGTGDARTDLLAIATVHPLREEVARELAERGGATSDLPERLVAEGLLVVLDHEGRRFYARRPAPGAGGGAR